MNKTQLPEKLLAAAEQIGLPLTIYSFFGNGIRVNLELSKAACDTVIEDLTFSVRSQNALKRAGLFTVRDVVRALSQDELGKIRNLGRKSISEIKTRILVFGYEALGTEGRLDFFRDIIAHNPENMEEH